MAHRPASPGKGSAMSAPITIAQSGPAVLYLFRIDPTVAQGRTLAEAPTSATIAAALGLSALPKGSAEVIRVADIAAIGLRDFLIQGHDVLPEALGPGTDWLDALEGHVLIVHARAAANGDITLHPGAGVQPLGMFAIGAPAPTPLQIPEPERPETLSPSPPPVMSRHSGGAAVLILFAVIAALVLILFFGLPRWPN